MLCDSVLGNVADGPQDATASTDWIDLHWHELDRRALVRQSRGEVSVRILLSPGIRLRHGDILWAQAKQLIAVNLLPTEVWVAHPRTLREMGALALEMGNLHAPVQLCEDELLAIPDGPVEAALARLRIPHELAVRRFTPQIVFSAPAPTLAAGFLVRPAAPELG